MIYPMTEEEQSEALERWLDKKSDDNEVHRPHHYINEEGYECKDMIRATLCHQGYLDYCRGAAIKYLWRYANKGNPVKDLKKAKQYIDMMIVELDGQ